MHAYVWTRTYGTVYPETLAVTDKQPRSPQLYKQMAMSADLPGAFEAGCTTVHERLADVLF